MRLPTEPITLNGSGNTFVGINSYAATKCQSIMIIAKPMSVTRVFLTLPKSLSPPNLKSCLMKFIWIVSRKPHPLGWGGIETCLLFVKHYFLIITLQIYSGKRIKRGLYSSSDGSLVNADINGSVNILRKYFKERKWNWTFQDHVRAFVNRPCQRVNPLCSSSIL